MKKILSLLIVFTMVLAFTACGEKEKKEEVNQSANESDLDYVKDNGKLIIGYTDYAP